MKHILQPKGMHLELNNKKNLRNLKYMKKNNTLMNNYWVQEKKSLS